MVLLTRSWEAGGDSKYLTFQISLKGEVLFFPLINPLIYNLLSIYVCLSRSVGAVFLPSGA